MSDNRLKISVGIATTGRREVLSRTIGLLAQQTRRPDSLVVCPIRPDDLDAEQLKRFPAPAFSVTGSAGLPAQRNLILSALKETDVIVFFDDDFFPFADYLAQVERFFLDHADIVALTGRPVRDGANGPGLTIEDALGLIDAAEIPEANDVVSSTYGTYGCNMAFRFAPIRKHQIFFDENIPLYGWQEDIDFSRALSPYGRIVEWGLLRGIHLGIKSGRTSGVRFGYSQVANPVYLIRKGTMSLSFAGPLVCRNVAANLLRSCRPESWIDRRGRLKGNVLALIDMVTGRISPRRILSLE
jgi:hypothetical protein